MLDNEGLAIVVFDADVSSWNTTESKRLQGLKQKYDKNKRVILCDSMPSVEFWFLIHFINTNKYYGTSKAVINELIKYIPKFDKTESFLSSPKWVEEMCKEGKFEKAYSRAQKLGMDGDSYSNVWKAIEYLGVLLLINNMGTALLALCFCALSLVLALFVGISPISDRAKIRFMYVGAALSLMAVPMMSHYIAGLNNIVDELRYQAVLVFIVVVCCYCFVMANMVKYNVMKKKVAVLEDTVEKLEQERAAAMSQAVDEDLQHKVQEALDWFAVKISVFSKEEQEAINACAIAFAERDQIVIPKVNIAVNAKCSQADLMAYASSAFFKIGKKRKDIARFLCIVFEAYFPGGEGFVYKKMPGAKQ